MIILKLSVVVLPFDSTCNGRNECLPHSLNTEEKYIYNCPIYLNSLPSAVFYFSNAEKKILVLLIIQKVLKIPSGSCICWHHIEVTNAPRWIFYMEFLEKNSNKNKDIPLIRDVNLSDFLRFQIFSLN